jgi:hypothetical protein
MDLNDVEHAEQLRDFETAVRHYAWCTSGHDPVRLLAANLAGADHHHPGIRVGEVHANMYRMVVFDNDQVHTEDRITIRLPGDPNPVDMSLEDRDALIAALQALPLPEVQP